MAGAVNIPIGLSITDLQTNFKIAGAATTAFTNQFKSQFGSLKGSADAPAGALNYISRQLGITKRQISDLIAVGAPIPKELAEKFTILKGSVDAAKSAFNAPIKVGAYEALNTRLAETKTRIQDILAVGGTVPDVVRAEFKDLETQVAKVNSEFDKVPSKAEKLQGAGKFLQSIGKPLSVLSAGIALVGAASFNSYAEIDAMQRALKVTAGSTEEANRQFAEFRELAKLPGLGFEEVTQAGLQLETLGYKAQTAERYVSEVGNAIALGGKGKTEFGQVITQFTQMAGKAKVLGDDLKPIVNASPVIAKAINDMFGTVDSEQISAKLQAAGKGPKDFIEALVNSLSKLERVSGGPKNAMENFGDSVNFAQAQLGKAADQALGLTPKINAVGDLIGVAADRLENMGSGAKLAVFGIASVIAVVGPLSLGLGTLITYSATIGQSLGLLKVGFLALTGPIGVTVAALAAVGIAAYSISQFNEELKSTVTTGQLAADVNKQVATSIAGETSRLDALLKVARDETAAKQARITAIKQINELSPKYLGDINLETINTAKASKAIQDYIRVLGLKAKAQAAERKLGEAQVKLEVANAELKNPKPQVSTMDALAATLKNPMEIFFGQGVDGKGRQDALAKTKQRQDIIAQDAKKEVEFYSKLFGDVTAELAKIGESVTPPIPSFKGGTGGPSDLADDRKRLKELKALIYEGQKNNRDVSSEIAEAKAIQDRIDAATKSYKTQKTAVDGANASLTLNARLLKESSLRLQELGDKAPESLKKDVELLTQAVELEKARLNLAKNPKKIVDVPSIDTVSFQPTIPAALGIGLNPVTYQKTDNLVSSILGNFQRISLLTPALFSPTGASQFLSSFQLAGPSLEFIQNKIEEIKKTIAEMTLNKEIVGPDLLKQLADLKKLLAEAMAGASAADAATNPGEQGEVDNKYIQKAKKRIDSLRKMGVESKQTVQEVADNLKAADDIMKGKGIELLQSFGEAVGKGENPLKAVLKLMLDYLGDFMIRIGSAMILGGTLLSGAIAAFPFLAPFLGIKGPAGVIAGGALVVGGGAVKGFAGSFEGGGLFKGESYIRVGESAKAVAGGGEFVAPVALGADLISARIMKSISSNAFRQSASNAGLVTQSQLAQQSQRNIKVEFGEVRLRKGDLAASVQDFERSNRFFN